MSPAARRRRFWNPAGIVFASLFLTVGSLFGLAAALALGWIDGPGGMDGAAATPFGPFGASAVALVFLYLGLRCNLWVDLTPRAVIVRGVLGSRRFVRDRELSASNDLRTRPTGLRLTSGDRSVVVYPRPRNADDLLRTLERP